MIRWIINLFRRKRPNRLAESLAEMEALAAGGQECHRRLVLVSCSAFGHFADLAIIGIRRSNDTSELRTALDGWMKEVDTSHNELLSAMGNDDVDFCLASKRGAERVVKAIEERLSELEGQRA